MDEKRLNEILKKYNKGSCTPEELKMVEQWYQGIADPLLQPPIMKGTPEEVKYVKDQYQRFLVRERREEKVIKLYGWLKVAVAILLLGVGAWFFIFRNSMVTKELQVASGDIGPGTDRAILTLGNGNVIKLSDQPDGNIATENGVQVTKTDSGALSYTGSASGSNNFNILSTPRGGKYKITLSDGTKVWLNAETVLKFPAAFSGSQRQVELNGEAYFEVAKNPAKPFLVLSKGQQIRVLGTHFNISNYANQHEVRTTLLEGKVAINALGKEITLSPGQQSVLTKGSLITRKADLEQAVAWKDGIIDLNGQNLEEIFNQIGRWYDVEVIIKGNIPERKLKGQMDRGLMLSQIVQWLQKMKIPVSLQEKQLIVSF